MTSGSSTDTSSLDKDAAQLVAAGRDSFAVSSLEFNLRGVNPEMAKLRAETLLGNTYTPSLVNQYLLLLRKYNLAEEERILIINYDSLRKVAGIGPFNPDLIHCKS